jgi:hypothetical protein
MEELRADMYHDEILKVKSCSVLCTVRTKVIIEDCTGMELFSISFNNDGSEFSFKQKGKLEYYKLKK